MSTVLNFLLSENPSSVASEKNNAFRDTVGAGILRPFVRDQKQDFANAVGADLIRSNVAQILGTLAQGRTNRGELRWRPEFGSLLPIMQYRNINEVFYELIRTQVADAIERWEPRVQVEDVIINDESTCVFVQIRYSILNQAQGVTVLRDQDLSFEFEFTT